MGDRVAIIGGSTVGRDHFPWPVEDNGASTGAKTGFPLDVDLPALCHFVYLARKWRFRFRCGFEASEPDIDPEAPWLVYEGSVDLQFDFEPTYGDIGVATREAQLVLPRVDTQIAEFSVAFDGTFTVESSAGAQITNISCAVDYPDGSRTGTLLLGELFFNPTATEWISASSLIAFRLGLTIDTGTSGSLIATNEAGGANSDQNLIVTTSFVADPGTEDGFNITLYRDSPLTSGDFYWITILFGEYEPASMQPIAFWPYANSNGDPVYNTTTGAQLTDPLG